MTKTWPVVDDNQKAAIISKQNRKSGWNRRWMQEIPIKRKGGFLLLNRENQSQFTGIINLYKKCNGLDSSPSNKSICNTLNRL